MSCHRPVTVLLSAFVVLALGTLAGCGDDDEGFGSIQTTTTSGAAETTTTGDNEETTTTGEEASGEATSVFDLEVGDCFDDPGTDVTEVEVHDCDDPHDNEVVFVFDVDLDEFPGEEEIRVEASPTCAEQFENYVGIPFEDSELAGGPLLVPSEESWNSGDREVICAAWEADFAKIEGSIEGAAR